MSVTKPPLGVIPRVLLEFMCDNYRKDSLCEAMCRYALTSVGEPIPDEWVEEYKEIIKRNNKKTGDKK